MTTVTMWRIGCILTVAAAAGSRSVAAQNAGAASGASAGSRPRTRTEITGLPALNFDADEGFGYGAVLAWYGYAANDSAYRWTLQPTVFLTTKGRRDYTVFFDAPSTAERPWRVTTFAGRQEQLASPYYGIGNDTPFDPTLDTGRTRYFYRYGHDRLRATTDVQHDLGRHALRLLVGAGASVEKINLTPFDSGTTLIAQQRAGVTPPDGRANFMRVGLTFDTRDREIGAHRGTWADLLVQRVDKVLGATDDYTRTTLTVREYTPLGSRFVLANRLLLQNVNGNAPFYALNEVQTTQPPADGLGGSSTVRGVLKDRYTGKGMLVSNNELRWRVTSFNLLGRPSTLVASGFVDAGRVWADGIVPGTALRDLHAGEGGGLRLALGESFVVALDAAHSAEATLPVYIGLGYMF